MPPSISEPTGATNAVLVVSPYAVAPPRYGGPLRVYNLCREISQHYRVTQFAQQVQRSNVRRSLRPVIQRITPTYLEYSRRDPLSLALYALTSLRMDAPPVWQSRLLSANAPRWLHDQLRTADLVHVEQPWQFGWVHRRVRGRKPLVLATQNVEAALYPPDRIKAPPRVARAIAREVVAQEAFAVRHADRIIAVSEADAAELARRYDCSPDRIAVVPNGVDCAAFVPASPAQREQRKSDLGLNGKRVVLFAGSLHPPNVEAVAQICRWAAQWPDPTTQFLVVGTVGRAFSNVRLPNVTFTGSVEATQPFFGAADIAINPMLSGSGTNLKQLEFMAMGLPTIATPVGARGIPIVDGVHGFIQPIDELPRQLRWVLEHPECHSGMGREGRRLMEQQFDWPILARLLRDVYDGLLN
jgi:glycosyltransferase involved in cell wall biosynthesis